jgi:hypothetical protein
MEKVIYVLSWPGGDRPAAVAELLRGEVAARLLDRGAHGVTVNVVDERVAPAAGLRMVSTAAPMEAMVSVWMDSANGPLRAPFDDAVALPGGLVGAYLVTESVPLVHRSSAPDGRVDGLAQVVFFRRPADLDAEAFLERWLGHHTQVAIDTQSTFSYVQHPLPRPLTTGAPPWDAIVEECFPTGAMTDPEVFYDAVGDPERLARHQREMMASVTGFIDLAHIEVIPTTRYDVA